MQSETGKHPEQVTELKSQKPIIYVLPTEKKSSVFHPPLLSTNSTMTYSAIVEANKEEIQISKRTSFLSDIKEFLRTEVTFTDIEPLLPYLPGGKVLNTLYAIANNISNKSQSQANSQKNVGSEEMIVDLAQLREKFSIDSWDDFVELIPYSLVAQDYEFPPGHPMPGRFYRIHPLQSKNRKYIPLENFDSLLFAERENELIRLLVDLGATKISIQEASSGKAEGSIKSGVSLQGAGGIQGNITGKNEQSNTESRVMLLRGKPWTSDMSFNEKEYNWLPYEPAWESLVHARLKGGCLSASVELTSDAYYSVSGKLSLTEGLLENLAAFGVGADFARFRQEKKLFLVEFADTLPSSETL